MSAIPPLSSTPPSARRLACEFIIAGAVCGAAYYFLADAANGKITAVRRDIAAAQQEEASRAGVDGLTDAQVAELKRTTLERAAEMRERSAPALDEAAMFARISSMRAMFSGAEIATTCCIRCSFVVPIS